MGRSWILARLLRQRRSSADLNLGLQRGSKLPDGSDVPKERSRSSSRSNIFAFASLKTIRFEMITAAGRPLNVNGIKTLRLSQSTMRRKLFEKVDSELNQFESRQKRAT